MIANGPAHALVEAEAVDVAIIARRRCGERGLVFVVVAGADVERRIEPGPAGLILRIGRRNTITELCADVPVRHTTTRPTHIEDLAVDERGRHARLHIEGQRELHIAIVGFECRIAFVFDGAGANCRGRGAVARVWRGNGKIGAVVIDVAATILDTNGRRGIAQNASRRAALITVRRRAVPDEIDDIGSCWADVRCKGRRGTDERNFAIRTGHVDVAGVVGCGQRDAVRSAARHLYEEVTTGLNGARERKQVCTPCRSGRARILKAPTRQRDVRRAPVVQDDEVVRIRCPGISTSAVYLANHDRTIAEIRARRRKAVWQGKRRAEWCSGRAHGRRRDANLVVAINEHSRGRRQGGN